MPSIIVIAVNVKGHFPRRDPIAEIYDIFERRRCGEVWVESFTGLPGLTERLMQLEAKRPGEYFACSVHGAKVVAELSRAANARLPADTHGHGQVAAHQPPAERGSNGNGTNGDGRNGNDVTGEPYATRERESPTGSQA
jgi:hypothetical protein